MHFQKCMNEMFQGLLHHSIHCYQDDVLGSGSTWQELLVTAGNVFRLSAGRNLYLKPSKCEWFKRRVIWVGREVSAEGIAADPAYTAKFTDVPCPTNAAQLQQLLAAMSWIRGFIPNYAVLVAPLQDVLNCALALTTKRNKQQAARIDLESVGWEEAHTAAFERMRTAVAESVRLAHPRADTVFCLFCDASDQAWGGILTQVSQEDFDSGLPPEAWSHQPTAFVSARYSGAALNWGTSCREGYACIGSIKRLHYLLERPRGFALFSDHTALRHIFSPDVAVTSQVTRGRLARWRLFLQGYFYTFHYLPGPRQVWADMLSRWGCTVPLPAPVVPGGVGVVTPRFAALRNAGATTVAFSATPSAQEQQCAKCGHLWRCRKSPPEVHRLCQKCRARTVQWHEPLVTGYQEPPVYAGRRKKKQQLHCSTVGDLVGANPLRLGAQ